MCVLYAEILFYVLRGQYASCSCSSSVGVNGGFDSLRHTTAIYAITMGDSTDTHVITFSVKYDDEL